MNNINFNFKKNTTKKEINEDKKKETKNHLYDGIVKLLNWANTNRQGMFVDFMLTETGPYGVHPYKGLNWGKDGGQRLKIIVTQTSFNNEETERIYTGESILLKWADDCVNGMMIRLMLDNTLDGANRIHPFEPFHADRKDGELMHLIAWAINDSEQIQNPIHIARRIPFSENSINYVKQAHSFCRNSNFVSFLATKEKEMLKEHEFIITPRPEEDAITYAGNLIKYILKINSRSELNKNTPAGLLAKEKWKQILVEFNAKKQHF